MEDFCRICSRSGEFQKFDLSIVSQISNVRIDDMIVYCTQQEVSIGDSLPQQICAACFTSLTSAFLFRKLTYQSENEFRQMIISTLTDQHDQSDLQHQEPIECLLSGIDPQVIIPDESILPDVAIKEEALELEEPLVDNILPSLLGESLLPIEDPPEGIVIPQRKPKGRGPTTYACKDCGYITQNCFNFKRHQQNQRHFSFCKLSTNRPLNVVKQILQQYISPAVKYDPPKQRKRRMKKPAKPERVPRVPRKPRMPGARRSNTLFRCDDCGYQNNLRFNFQRHQKNWNHTRTSTFQNAPMNSTTEKSMLECRDCGIEFSSNVKLKAHRRESCPKKIEPPNPYANIDEVLALCRNMAGGTVRKRRKRKVETTEVKAEPLDNEPISELKLEINETAATETENA